MTVAADLLVRNLGAAAVAPLERIVTLGPVKVTCPAPYWAT